MRPFYILERLSQIYTFMIAICYYL